MTLYILKLLYPGCSTKEVRTLPLFAEHLKFQEKTNFQKHFGWIAENLNRQSRINKQYHCLFRGVHETSRINDCYTSALGKSWQIKKRLESGHHTYWNFYIQGAPRKKQYHCFFYGCFLHGAPQGLRKSGFYRSILGELRQIKIKKIRWPYIWKMLYTDCSTKEAISLILL